MVLKQTLKTKPDNEGEPPEFIQTMLKLLINIDKNNHTISIQWLIKIHVLDLKMKILL